MTATPLFSSTMCNCDQEDIPSRLSDDLHNSKSVDNKELVRFTPEGYGEESSLNGIIPDSGQRYAGPDFRMLFGPGVYAFLKKGLPIYVGCSKKNLIGRVSCATHEKGRKALKECDEVLLYPCVSPEAAESLETFLIGRMKPRLNQSKRYVATRKLLGITGAVAWKILEQHGWHIKPSSASPAGTPESVSAPDLPLQGQLSLGGAL